MAGCRFFCRFLNSSVSILPNGFHRVLLTLVEGGRLRNAAHWPIAQGYIAQIEEKRDDNGFLVVTVAYTYKVEDERYVGREPFPFVRDEDVAKFEAGCKERSILVHYRPDKPDVSALARENMPS